MIPNGRLRSEVSIRSKFGDGSNEPAARTEHNPDVPQVVLSDMRERVEIDFIRLECLGIALQSQAS